MKLVAVLGYSGRRDDGLHPVCAQRLAHAEGLAEETCTVVLSGESELMRPAWKGIGAQIVVDSAARNTAQNAAGIAAIAREVGADEVVLVTSRWHAPRARLLLRAALRGSGIEVTTSSPPDAPPARLLLRELACLAAAPFQAARLR